MTETTVGFRLQTLERVDDRVLAAAYVVGVRAGGMSFAAREIRMLLEGLRVPAIGGLSQALNRLSKAGLVRQTEDRTAWLVSPTGEVRVRELLSGVAVASIETELSSLGFAMLQGFRHPLIPPELAPARFAHGVGRLLSDFPFERNIFVMTRFPKETPESEMPDPVHEIIEMIRDEARKRGMVAHLASDRSADDELFGNIAAHMWACKFGIGLFETRYGTDFNDNLQIEIGAMLMTGRRCMLLKDFGTPAMPTDFVGQIFTEVDFADVGSCRSAVRKRLAADLTT